MVLSSVAPFPRDDDSRLDKDGEGYGRARGGTKGGHRFLQSRALWFYTTTKESDANTREAERREGVIWNYNFRGVL